MPDTFWDLFRTDGYLKTNYYHMQLHCLSIEHPQNSMFFWWMWSRLIIILREVKHISGELHQHFCTCSNLTWSWKHLTKGNQWTCLACHRHLLLFVHQVWQHLGVCEREWDTTCIPLCVCMLFILEYVCMDFLEVLCGWLLLFATV